MNPVIVFFLKWLFDIVVLIGVVFFVIFYFWYFDKY